MDFKSSKCIKGHSLNLAESLEVERGRGDFYDSLRHIFFGISAHSAAEKRGREAT